MRLENEAGGNRHRRSREEVKRLVDEFEASGLERAPRSGDWAVSSRLCESGSSRGYLHARMIR
jgi:ribosomal protein L32